MIRDYHDPDCAVARSLEVLGDGWTLLVVREAFLGTRRFADFAERLGISRNVLTARLQHLVESGVLEKVDAGQYGERFEYQLTPKGKDLLVLMTAIRQWGDRWIFGPGKEPLLVIDQATGQPVERLRIRRADGSPVPSADLRAVPGPGASEALKERASEPLEPRRDPLVQGRPDEGVP
ncbi:MAG: helix-turn-helix transcriptional regulator [Alphaproteobacteria bacterium]|nr:helix-turn-helix transcriptional regulator [Alphaproteobacteria bacterium]